LDPFIFKPFFLTKLSKLTKVLHLVLHLAVPGDQTTPPPKKNTPDTKQCNYHCLVPVFWSPSIIKGSRSLHFQLVCTLGKIVRNFVFFPKFSHFFSKCANNSPILRKKWEHLGEKYKIFPKFYHDFSQCNTIEIHSMCMK